MFIAPTRAVSSSNPSGPSSASSAAAISSVTATGVRLMAAAYSITPRSSGEYAADVRHRRTSEAFSSVSPWSRERK